MILMISVEMSTHGRIVEDGNSLKKIILYLNEIESESTGWHNRRIFQRDGQTS